MLESIKQHKWLFGGVAIAAILVLWYANQSSASGATTGSSGDVASAENWQQAQLQAATQSQQYSTALQAQGENDATQIALATIQAHTADNANTLAANVAAQQLNVDQQSYALHDTLSATIAENNNATTIQLANINTGAQEHQIDTIAGAMITQANLQAQTAQQSIAATREIATQSVWHKVFG